MRVESKLGWIVCFVAAMVVGAAWRLVRRLFHRPPRIWHGHWPVHMTRDMARADRLAGFPSRSVTIKAEVLKYPLVSEQDFDIVLMREGVAPDTLDWRAMIDLHLHGDIWVAYFDCLFFPVTQRQRNDMAFRMIRLAGIRIIVVPHGSDIIQVRPEKTRYDWIGRMQVDYPNWNLGAQTVVSQTRIELFERYAALVVAADPATARLMRRTDLVFKYFPVDIPPLESIHSRENTAPRIVHAPNHRNVKGTDFLLRAVDRLQTAGIECELTLVEGVPRAEALDLYRQADIIADQFCIGAFGVFALEAMALGKPVLAYLDEEHLANRSLNLPIVHTTPQSLPKVLAVLIAVPELRTRLGQAGRAAVGRYQSYEAIGEVWSRLYRHVWWGEVLDLASTRHFGPERTSRSPTEDPAQEEFWPVAVDDLMSQIRVAIKRIT